ncbi:MAG: type II toxin-antitoxin system RelE/ParE family toxin [Thermomonas sp.]|uniref:type II toxin-antitoxin system RelE/ParE family toxin n=1 Tax=Thermomonas sp. TaxID=1971895 RepID=UPI0039E56EBA
MELKRTPEFKAWIDALRDVAGRARIQARIERLAGGNPGDLRNLGGGVSELRIDTGPGYRVYYTKRGNILILLLVGGDKTTQQEDIRRAQEIVRHL